MKQMDLTDIYRTFDPKTKGYTFFSTTHGTFSKTDLNRYKKIEIIPCILSDHHGVWLLFNNSTNNRKLACTQKVNNTLLSDNFVKEEEIKKLKTF